MSLRLRAKNLPWTEADLLADFYFRARNAGLNIRMEVFVPSHLHRSKFMRVDAVCIANDEIVAFIEGKSPGAKCGGNTRQKHAYENYERHYETPVFWINCFTQIDGVIKKLHELCGRVA